MSIWRLIAHHADPCGAIEVMKHRNRIAIGWTAIGDLRQSSTPDQSSITRLISKKSLHLKNANLGGPSLWNFYQLMELGDLIILNADGKRICVFEVVGPYVYESGQAEIMGYGHQRTACLTDLNPDDLWVKSGSAVANGQNIRWTLAGCAEPPTAKDAIYKEGRRFSVVSTVIERNPIARQKCIDHFGCKCYVCKFEFKRTYGELGGNYIHVHHKTDIATRDGEHDVDPVRDLVPLCPNCHAMVHQKMPSIPVEELAAMYARHNT